MCMRIFLPKNLHMSDNCSTFALGIGKATTSSGEADRATQGCDLGGIAGRKTHTASARRKRGEPFTNSGSSLFRFL